MKKFMMMIMFVLVMFSASYGEELNTIKDVREEIRAMKKEFRADINTLEKETRQGRESLMVNLYKVSGDVAVLSQRMDSLNFRFKDLRDFMCVTLFLVVISLLPSVQKFIEWRDSRKPSITLEDVKRLIEESKSEPRSA